MAAEYQEPDWRVVDYQAYCLDENVVDRTTKQPLFVRGPKPPHLEPNGYFICLGSAQTFGRFCERPYPIILHERLGLPVLNISHGGAGPLFFCGENGRLLEYLNGARFVIVQVMSGRSDSNSLFESEGVGYFRRRSDGANLACDEAFSDLIRNHSRATLIRIVEETRQSWCASYHKLLTGIQVPKILFWFATRPLHYKQGWKSLVEVFGEYPQLVNAEMVARVKRFCDSYVECVTKRGIPETLIDRFTGLPTTVSDQWTSEVWKVNWYYPSPEMHEDAANALEPACQTVGGLGGVERAAPNCLAP